MAALNTQYMGILREILRTRFVQFLPPLLGDARPDDRANKQISRAFSAFALHKKFGLNPQEAARSVVDDFDDKGLDAIYYHQESETLYVVQAKLKEADQFQQNEALAVIEGLRLLLAHDFTLFNTNIQNRQTEIEAALASCSHIRLLIPYTGERVSGTAMDVLTRAIAEIRQDEERLDPQIVFFEASEIEHHLRAEQAYKPVDGEIRIQHAQKIEEPRPTYFGLARLSDLVAMHCTHGKSLYEKNIRYFLGSSKSEVNRAIKGTLDRSPDSFFYLNNGVTAICTLIEPKETRGGFKRLKIKGFSVINGAQTIASAAEYVDQNPAKDLSDAKVMLTLIKVSADGAFGKQITKARNHQNQVQTSNFASLDEVQERLRQDAGLFNYRYVYRPEASERAANIITMDEAMRALALLQSDPRYPVWVKSDPGRISNPDQAEYKAIFHNGQSACRLINATLCFRLLLGTFQRSELSSSGQERLIYRHGNYAILTVFMRRLKNRIESAEIINTATLSALISAPFDQLRQSAFDITHRQLFGIGPLAFFRNQTNVQGMLIDLMIEHYGLTADQAIPHLRNVANATDAYPRQRLVEYICQRAPQI